MFQATNLTVSLYSDGRNRRALLDSSGRGSDSSRENGSDSTRLHRDEMKIEDMCGWVVVCKGSSKQNPEISDCVVVKVKKKARCPV